MTKFIFVFGGVISGVGKGVTTASLGKMLKSYGFKTTLIKIDPYLNFDAGTLRPTEHGEVWVTEDGGEIDQDLGTYERFMDENIPKQNNITSGQIYKTVIDNERSGNYLGKTVQFIPHIPQEIIRRLKLASDGYEIAIVEVGGTVGDYENTPFLFAAKSLEQECGKDSVAHVLVSYLPVPYHIYEMKTKPTQQAVRLLRQEGLVPDFIVCRTAHPIDDERKKKIETSSHILLDHIISAPDVSSIYEVPLNFARDDFGKKMIDRLKLSPKAMPNWNLWKQQVDAILKPDNKIRVGIVGKYLDTGSYELQDSYVSIAEALVHASAYHKKGCEIVWLDAKSFEVDDQQLKQLDDLDGVIIPGGFGMSGVEGKINVISYLREHMIPFLGLCYGMQLAVVEFARNVAQMCGAHTTEVNKETPYPVIDLLPMQKELLKNNDFGGTMRLGAYSAMLKKHTKVYDLYSNPNDFVIDAHTGEKKVFERHRHRYEVHPDYVEQIERAGLVFSGYHERADGTCLMEYIELPNHPFFVASQAHPEFKSRLANPNPIFAGFIRACVDRMNQRIGKRSSAVSDTSKQVHC
ncbi:MAG: CTP synthase [Candidatus Dependentiae bacterium]